MGSNMMQGTIVPITQIEQALDVCVDSFARKVYYGRIDRGEPLFSPVSVGVVCKSPIFNEILEI